MKFTFDHLLSQVKFTLKNGFGANTKVRISNFRFYGMKTKGDCDYETNAWKWTLASESNDDLTESNTSFKSAEGDTYEAIGADPAQEEATATDVELSWVVIPQEMKDDTYTNDENNKYAKTVVTFDAKVIGKDNTDTEKELAKKTITARIPTIIWAAGNSYNYNLVIDAPAMGMTEYIIFGTPTITDWNSTTTTVDVPAGNITSTDTEEAEEP